MRENKNMRDIGCLIICICLLISGCKKTLPLDQLCPSLVGLNDTNPIVYLPGLKGLYRAESTPLYDVTSTLVSGPKGLSLRESGLIEWTPSLTIATGMYDVTLENRGEVELLKLVVLPSRPVKGESKGEFFKVTDKESDLFGYVFEFKNNISVENLFREVSKDCLPKQDYFHKTVSSGFYSLSDIDFDLYVPENKVLFTVWNPYSVPRTESHYWSNYQLSTHGFELRSHWNDFHAWSEQTRLEGTKYLKYENMNANSLIVIGLSSNSHKAR